MSIDRCTDFFFNFQRSDFRRSDIELVCIKEKSERISLKRESWC